MDKSWQDGVGRHHAFTESVHNGKGEKKKYVNRTKPASPKKDFNNLGAKICKATWGGKGPKTKKPMAMGPFLWGTSGKKHDAIVPEKKREGLIQQQTTGGLETGERRLLLNRLN